MKPKILHVIGQMVRGGAERQLLNVCAQLGKRGWPQAVVTFQPGSPWDQHFAALGIPLFPVAPSRIKAARLLRLAQIIARERPAIVHSWSHHTNVYAGHVHRVLGFEFIASLRHNPLVNNQTGESLKEMPHAATYARADCVLSNSCVSLGMARMAGLRPKREALVSNIVFPQAAANPGLRTACPHIITVGNLTDLKGHEDLIRALGILAGEGLDFRLSIVGEGPQRSYLQKLASDHCLQGRTQFHGEVDDLNGILQSCQIMAHPSRMEGLSNAILEGMYSRLAVCATSVGATPEYIEHGVTGLLAPPQDHRRLASNLRELICSPELRSRLGGAAHERVLAKCSPSVVVAQYESCYRMLGEKRTRYSRRTIGNPFWGTRMLMYHNILDRTHTDAPVASHQTTLDGFRKQMLTIRDRVVNPAELHEAIVGGRRLPKGILITFDDGAAGLAPASGILAELGLAGVAFICPGALQMGLWFYRLADALHRSQMRSVAWRGATLALSHAQDRFAAYRVLYRILACEVAHIREESLSDLVQLLKPTGEDRPKGLEILDEPGLKRAAATGSLYFANHTWSHPNLTALSLEEIQKEIHLAKDWLQASGLPTLPWLAFPQGHYDHRVLAATREAGLIPFGAETANPFQRVFTRIGVYRMDSQLARFRLKLLLKPAC